MGALGMYENQRQWYNILSVTKYVWKHTFNVDVVKCDHQQASSPVVSECIKNKFSEDVLFPKKIINHMRTKFGVGISYYKAWQAIELALRFLRGSTEDSYALLLYFTKALMFNNIGLFLYSNIFIYYHGISITYHYISLYL